MIRATTIEVGVRGQLVTVRGGRPPDGESRYGSEQEFEVDLTLARELYRLLGKLIPLAEKSTPPAPVISMAREGGAA